MVCAQPLRCVELKRALVLGAILKLRAALEWVEQQQRALVRLPTASGREVGIARIEADLTV